MIAAAIAEPRARREAPDVESSTEGYARRFAGPVGTWFLDVQATATLSLLSHLRIGARVLDVGGGHAQLAPVLADAGYEVTVLGSDPSCAKRLGGLIRAGRCRFEVASLGRLPHADRSFDAVLAFRMLPHLEDWRAFIGELCRVAGGSVVLDYPSRRSVNRLADSLFGLKQRIEGDTRRFTLFRPTRVAAELRRHGFEVRASRPQFLLPMALHRMHGSVAAGRLLEAPGRLLGLTRVYGSPVVVRADAAGHLGRSPDRTATSCSTAS